MARPVFKPGPLPPLPPWDDPRWDDPRWLRAMLGYLVAGLDTDDLRALVQEARRMSEERA